MLNNEDVVVAVIVFYVYSSFRTTHLQEGVLQFRYQRSGLTTHHQVKVR